MRLRLVQVLVPGAAAGPSAVGLHVAREGANVPLPHSPEPNVRSHLLRLQCGLALAYFWSASCERSLASQGNVGGHGRPSAFRTCLLVPPARPLSSLSGTALSADSLLTMVPSLLKAGAFAGLASSVLAQAPAKSFKCGSTDLGNGVHGAFLALRSLTDWH